jgi:alanine racemase
LLPSAGRPPPSHTSRTRDYSARSASTRITKVTYPATTGEFDAAPPQDPRHERSAVIDLDAIRHNVRRLAAAASPAKVMAVVKADAYGHGAVQVARAALEAGAAWLGVAHISEALALRAAGIDAPLLAWLHTTESNFGAAVAAGVDIGCSGWELDRIVAAAREQERPARIHLKVDTGLGRNGATLDTWDSLVGEAMEYQDQGLLRVVGIFSHLAVADEPERPETDQQLAAFREVLAVAEDAGVDPEVRHLANTPATLSRPDTHFDLVRVGLGIYGLSPFDGQTSAELGLRPAMTLRTVVSQCKEVPDGQGVSYGLRYHTSGPSTLALIPVGYADGVPRVATGGPVRVAGKTYPVVGRIAMDQMVIDLGDAGPAGAGLAGAEAQLFGDGADGGPTADDWARAAGTINYEIVTRISPRVPRRFINEQAAAPAVPGEAGAA